MSREGHEEGQQLVADIRQIAVETIPCRALAEDAHALANATGRTVYDSMYVALAVRLHTRSITSDERLEAALKSLPAVADHIQLVQTFERDARARLSKRGRFTFARSSRDLQRAAHCGG